MAWSKRVVFAGVPCLVAWAGAGCGTASLSTGDASAVEDAGDASTEPPDSSLDALLDAKVCEPIVLRTMSMPACTQPGAPPATPVASTDEAFQLPLTPPIDFRRVRDLTYATRGGKVLLGDLLIPKSVGSSKPGVLVVIHGGGWKDCARRRAPVEAVAGIWAALGNVAAFNIEYRLLQEGGAFPENIGDVHCALHWISKEASRFGLDGSKLVLAGESAGAHLSALAAMTVGDPAYVPAGCELAPGTVKGSMNFSGVYDLPLFASRPTFPEPKLSATGDSPRSLVEGYTRTACVEKNVLATSCSSKICGPCVQASPVAHACGTKSEMLLVQAEDPIDPLVPMEQTLAFMAGLSAAGIPTELVKGTAADCKDDPSAGHGFSPCLVRKSVPEVTKFLSRLRP